MRDMGISETATLCQHNFSSLISAAAASNLDDLGETLSLRNVKQLQERLDQWAGNLGARQPVTSPLSLEHRLRNSPVVRDAVLWLLGNLVDSLVSAIEIAAGRRRNRRADPLIDSGIDLAEYDLSSSDSDSDCDSTHSAMLSTRAAPAISEIEELMLAIKHGIDSLFRTSIFVRKHAPRNKRQRASAAKPFDNRADVMYVKDRYPLAAVKNEALVARLGEANARRRQYFKYCRDHNERLSNLIAEKTDAQMEESQPGQAPETSHVAGRTVFRHIETNPSLLVDTKATEFGAGEPETAQLSKQLEEQSVRSVVSFATTVAEPSDDELGFPLLPSEAKSNSMFLCPYCFTVIALKGENREHQWKLVIHPPKLLSPSQ
jgi:hypothetical protein